MPILMPGKKRILYVGIIVLLGISLGGWACWRLVSEKSAQSIPVGTFSMDAVMRVQPQWDRYEQLSKDIGELQKKLHLPVTTVAETKGEGSETSSFQPSPGGLFFPSDNEAQVSPGAINQTLALLQENLMKSMQLKYQERGEQLQTEIMAAVSKLQADYDQQYQDYRRGIELEYSAKLSDLNNQLQNPGLSELDKNDLNNQVFTVKAEMNNLISAKQKSFVDQMKAYQNQRRQEAEKIMKDYQNQLRAEFDRQMKRKAQEVQTDALNLNAMLAERQTLRFEMISVIRRQVKKAAKAGNMAFILTNPSDGYRSTPFILAFPQGKDMTKAIKNYFR